MSITSVKNDTLGKDSFVNSQKPVPPTISGYTISGVDDTALDTAGGQTILINGTGFQRGATVVVDGTTVPVVSFISSNQLSFTSIVKSAGSYAIYVVNADLGTAIYIPGLIYSTLPTWTTGAGSLGSYYETTAISNTVVAGGDAPLTYALASGTLPSGATISSSGIITGTSPADTGSTTYSFTVEAIDAQLQSSTRSFSLTINTDVVTWNSPGTNTTIALDGAAHSSTLSATSAAGYGVAYAADTLPPGLTLIGDTISGTPTTQDTTVSVLTATANTTGRSTTNTITWVVSLGDIFFNLTTMLLSSNATTFVSDASANNLAVTVVGDTKPSNFSPYLTGWSNQFDGTGDYLSVPNNSNLYFGSGDFTVEFWYNSTIPFTTGYGPCMGFGYKGGTTTGGWVIYRNTVINTDRISVRVAGQGGAGFVDFPTSSTVETNKWNHWALVRSGTSLKWYKNGVLDASTTNSVNITDTDTTTLGYVGYAQQWGYNAQCYLSNVRIVKGTAVYTDNFTTPTQPLTSIAGTSLLTCQSNRIRDASSNNFAITRNGDVAIQSFSPFTETATTRGSGYFDGTGDYLTVPANTNLALGAGDYTVECWVNLQGTQTTQYGWGVFGTYPGSGTGGWSLTVNRSQGGQGIVWILGSTIIVDYTGAYIPTNTWAHIAVCRSGSGTNNTKIFLNGVMVNQVTNNTNDNFSGLTYIGGQGTGQLFTGYISNARVVKGTAVYTANFTPPTVPLTAVTNTSLLTLQTNNSHTNNQFLDSSGSNLLITRAGNATQGTFSPYSPSGWSNYFGTTTMGIQTPASSLTNIIGTSTLASTSIFTIEAWINPASRHSGSAATQGFVAGSMNITGGQADWGFGPDSNGLLSVWWWNGSSIVRAATTNAVPLNTWTHIATTISSGVIKIFINGVQETLTGTTTVTSVSPALSYFTVGGYTAGGSTWQGFNGYISNLRVVRSVLYTSNFTPSTQPLTAIAGTSLLTCCDNRFIDESPNNFAITRTNDVRVVNFSPHKAVVQTPVSYSAYFDGSGDYLTLPSNQAQFSMSTGDFTIEMWVYISSLASTRTLYDTMNSGDTTGTGRFAMQVTTSGTVQIFTGAGSILTSGGTVTVGAWTHIAYAKASNSGRLYVNGTQVNSAYTDNNNYVVGSTSRPIIGVNAYDNSTNPMLGYISNLRLVKGTAVYTANFTPSTSPLTAVSGTSLLACQNATFTDNSTNHFAVTATGNTQPTTVNPFGSTFTNSSGYTAADHGGSTYFDGTGDWLTIPNSTALNPGTGNFTIEAWVYLLNTNERQIFSGSNNGVVFGVNNLGQFTVGQANVAYLVSDTTAAIAINQWTHLAAVRQGTTLTLYRNGVNVGSATNSTNFVTSSTNYIGGNGTNSINAYISNLRLAIGTALYTSNFVTPTAPLLPVPNTTLLLNGTSAGITDATTKNVLETVGDVKTSSFGPYSGSYYSNQFDGSGDRLTITNNGAFDFGSGDFTIEAWVNPQSFGNLGLVFFSSFIPSSFRFVTYLSATGVGVDSGGQMTFSGTTICSVGTWYHCALVRSGNSFKTYINGILNSTATYSNPYWVTAGTSVTVGDYSDDYSTGFGFISNLRVVKGTAVYTSNFTPSTTPLTAVSGTSLLTCQSNKFVDNSTNNLTITRVGDARVATQNPFQVNSGQSIVFDGTGDYVLTPTTQTLSFETGDFTVECWVYLNSFGASYVPIFNNAYLFYVGASGQMLVYNGSADVATGPNGAVSLNSWFHLSWVRTSGTIKMFVNGVQSGSNATVTALIGSGSPNRIGAHSAAHLNGYISDLRITKGTARYTTNFTPPTAALQNK